MMDAVPAIDIAAPAREVVCDHRGAVLGSYEHQRFTGKLVARDARGVPLGIFDGWETRDARGRVIERGNVLGALVSVQGR